MKVFYDARQSSDLDQTSFPSAGKPKKIMDRLIEKNIIARDDIMKFEPVTKEMIYLCHDRDHVDDILSLKKENGFSNRSISVRDSLFWTLGSMLSATEFALQSRTITMSPTSGFHHAGYFNSDGFCTFNGLMISAVNILKREPSSKIAILDYDYHFGDGTEDILRRLPNYQARVLNISSGARFHQQSDGEKFLQNIEFDLSAIIEFGADIVLYQAGADQHCKDPLGGMLNTDELKLRDRMVFTGLLSSGIGVSWNLAGGYQTPFENVLEIHENTAKEAIEACRKSSSF